MKLDYNSLMKLTLNERVKFQKEELNMALGNKADTKFIERMLNKLK